MAFLVTLAAGPRQDGLPLQPFFTNAVPGSVTLEGKPGPANTILVARIDDYITVFETVPLQLSQDGLSGTGLG
ncbi:MAG: hypothetical protein BZY80_07230 [SAR202 cluster bacterium Io17-Chloro-G2]|nr:MAG: hypothetical protein BZY80_07230 [SAR202 cluster bacterium Io17-Chloro-G2]